MSTLKVDSIESRTSGNRVVLPDTNNYPPFRNIIINGDMSVAQRSTSESSITDSGYHTIDRFKWNVSASDTVTLSQSTDVPSGQGFAKSYKVDVTTADASIGASEFAHIQHRIEAQFLQHLKYGTSSAETLTLSFWVKSTKTGTYCIALEKEDNTRYDYVAEYTISSASTWEKKTITITPDSNIQAAGGAIDNNNGEGFNLKFVLAAGSSRQGSNETWNTSTPADGTSNQVNFLDSTSNDFYLTGVQLEVGDSATPFEFLPKEINLQRCMRYYQIYNYMGNPGGEIGHCTTARQSSATNKQWMITTTLPVGLRSSASTMTWDSARTGSAGSGYDGSWLYESGSATNRWTAPTNYFQTKADGDTYSQVYNSITSVITDNTNFTNGETLTFSSRLILDAEL